MLKSLICNNKQQVSLTTDLWTSVQNMSYMVITNHFIDSDWCLNRKIISFSAIEDHRGKTIGKKIVACLQDWGIERLFAIIVDNATANDIAIGYVTMQLLTWRNDNALVLAGQYIHVCCCAHILNLIVVSRLGELHTSVTAIRNVVKYVRSSSTRLQTFKQCAKQVNCPKGIVVLDCPARWNSTYLMLMTALKFQAAFDRMAEVDKPYEAYFAEKENNVRRVGPPGPEDWESTERIVKFLKANLVDVTGGECDDPFRVARPFLGYARKVSVHNESRRVVFEVERYPILENIARDVLVVPVSTVAYESTLSIGRRIIDENRSSLTPAMVEALICTENWLQSKLFANPVYNLQEDIKEQMFHMELQEELIRSQASTMEAVSAEIGVMDV
ncbi:hypothetical protein KPL70_023270 [Citrus sinensis]|nr:hypothetical protein KPL70_023270 [Citrus sinensis]